MKKYLLFLAIIVYPVFAGLNIGRWQNGGSLDIGRWQNSGGEAGCTAPSISDTTDSGTVGTPLQIDMIVSNADSVIDIDGMPDGLSIDSTGANIGRISGTPGTEAAVDTFRVVAYGCSGDSTDTANFIITILAAPPDSFTLDTNAVNGQITLDPAPGAGGKYQDGDTVICTADPDPYYSFSEWQDSLTGSTNPDTIVMDTNKVVTAVFTPDSVSVTDVDPDSGVAGVAVITITGTNFGASQSSSTLAMGDSSMGTAQSWSNTEIVDTVPAGLDTGWYDFIVTCPINSDTLDSAFKVVEAAPAQFTVSFDITGSGTASGDGVYDSLDTAFIELTPATHWHCITDSIDTIVVVKDTVHPVVFGIDTFSVAAVSDVGAAITFPDDSIGGYGDTIVAVLTVAADSLANWEGGNNITPGTDTFKVYLTADTTLTAVSRQWPKYDIDTATGWGGNISSWTIDSISTIDSGTVVHTTVVCEACSSFAGYTGDYTGSSASGSFSLDSNMTIGASCEYGTCSSNAINRRKNPFKIWRSFRVW